jgi:putative copper export protein
LFDQPPPNFLTVLPVTANSIRLFLHVLAATIWVGGQFTLAGLVPGLRTLSQDAPRVVARRFNRIAWPAFVVLVITGIWNVGADTSVTHGKHGTTLALKLAVVAISGLAAWAHSLSKSKLGLAFFGALSALSALAALFLGVLLAG